MELTVESVPFIFFGIIILCGNVFVCLLYATNQSLRSITNKFVVSLAFCDIIIATTFIPLYIFHTKHGKNYVAALSSFGSLFNLLALTYDRYIAIFHGLRYFNIMSDKKIRLLMTEVWSGTILVTLFPLPWEMLLSQEDFIQWNRVYVGILTALVILVTIIVFLTYLKIFKVSAQHAKRERGLRDRSESHPSAVTNTRCLMAAGSNWRRFFYSKQREKVDEEIEMTSQSQSTESSTQFKKQSLTKRNRRWSILREVKAARIIAVVFVFNFICWLPIIIINICDVISPQGQAPYLPIDFLTISLYLFIINSSVNPLIYAVCKKDFRKVIRRRLEIIISAMEMKKSGN
eukprot:gene12059-13302_t